MDLTALNRAPPTVASEALGACCGSAVWVSRMLASRPFATRESLFATADAIWNSLTASDWLEAFSHHPRIGESRGAEAQSARARGWSAGEQAAVHRATQSLRDAQREMNLQYERKFGYIYIVCAAGKAADELLAIAEARLANDPGREILVAAEEQRKITRLRLEKLLEAGS